MTSGGTIATIAARRRPSARPLTATLIAASLGFAVIQLDVTVVNVAAGSPLPTPSDPGRAAVGAGLVSAVVNLVNTGPVLLGRLHPRRAHGGGRHRGLS